MVSHHCAGTSGPHSSYQSFEHRVLTSVLGDNINAGVAAVLLVITKKKEKKKKTPKREGKMVEGQETYSSDPRSSAQQPPS